MGEYEPDFFQSPTALQRWGGWAAITGLKLALVALGIIAVVCALRGIANIAASPF